MAESSTSEEQKPNPQPSQSQIKSKSKSKKPSDEEIEAIRKERAEKKERKIKEEKEKQSKLGISTNSFVIGKDGKIPFEVRKWSKVKDIDEASLNNKQKWIKLISWNILAQGLVRRKLFPGSDCLKWKDREIGLKSEMLSLDWDLATFQEVDRIEIHGENLKQNGKRFVYAKGYNEKQHGLMISWRIQQQYEQNSKESQSVTIFEEEPVASKVIFFDRENVDSTINEKGKRLGLSRVTRNIALFVALRFKKDDKSTSSNSPSGIIISATHLFWHPMHAYERVRQMGIMKRRLQSWKEEHGKEWSDWPIFLSGDFNDQPHSATYKLVTGQPITQHCLDEVRQSTVVHQSVDELRKKIEMDSSSITKEEAIVENGNAAQQDASGAGNEEEEEDEEEEDGGEAIDEEEGEDDQILKNCRLAKEEDGLLSFDELVQLHDLSKPPPSSNPQKNGTKSDQNWLDYHLDVGIQSLYGMNFNKLESDQTNNYFSSSNRWRERHDDMEWTPNSENPHLHIGSFEPMYTLFSPLFCLTLDYIFIFPPNNKENEKEQSPIVTALLPTHKTEILQPGIPRKNVCASDHIVIGAEVAI